MPTEIDIPGSTTVLGWAKTQVLVNKLPLENVQQWIVSRDLNIGPGTGSLTISDPNRSMYDIFQPTDEIEIYISSSLNPTIGIKLWGGYVDSMKYDTTDAQKLTMSAKEYISRLQSQTTTVNVPTANDLGTIIKNTIMTQQVDFTTEGIPDIMGYMTTANATNETIYNVLKQLCDQFGLYFWIDPKTKDLSARFRNISVVSPDSILATVNFLRSSNISKNSEYLTNSVVVNVDGATSNTITDATSQANYGVFSRSLTVGNLADQISADSFGASLVSSKNAPLDAHTLDSLMLAYTEPGDFLFINVPVMNLNGYYQALNVAHTWKLGEGLSSTVQIGNQLPDSDVYIADLNRRLTMVEQKAF